MTEVKRFPTKLNIRNGKVDMSHGSGGRASAQLIEQLFIKYLDNPLLRQGNDGTVFPSPGERLVMSTDSHVISPLFFPGGNIGSLAIHGTVNDLAMSGAKPLYLSAGFILEEGFPLADLEVIIKSMAQAANDAGVAIITGDTKVVEKGKGDGVFINTAGVGVLETQTDISGDKVRPGDAIIVSGSLGDHGVAIMSSRENLEFDTEILSDSAALNSLVAAMIGSNHRLHCLRDPTRGGLATSLNEIAQQSGVGIKLNEPAIPIKPAVNAACELLGLDPLYVANEGKLICICPQASAQPLLNIMRDHPLGAHAAIIGEATEDPHHFVLMETAFGGQRIVDWLAGEQLPRIC